MLKATVGIALLVTIALVGYRRTFTRLRLPIGAQNIFLTGTEFILVGVALGDEFTGVLGAATLMSLTPLLALCLGFTGLLFGIQFDLDKVVRFPARYAHISMIQALVTMAVVFVPFLLLVRHLFPHSHSTALMSSLVLSATAACTGVTTIALLSRELRLRNTLLLELLRYISGIDAVVGVTAVGAAFCFLHSQSPLGVHPGVWAVWLAISIIIGISMGFLLNLLSRTHCRQDELTVFVLGVVLFAAGLSQFLRISPLFVCMVVGITMANSTGAANRVFNILSRLEKPFYIVLLILAGALWRSGSYWAWIFAIVYLVLRTIGKVAGGLVASRLGAGDLVIPRSMGLGLLSQGGIAVAMVVNYTWLTVPAIGNLVITAVLTAVITNEFVSPTLTRRTLTRAGEIET